ncbi:MAG TPA: LysR substrate-binding domain-containing protein [Spirochaetia bacterium]|nr:LysR substrate-binding domain-containing protein [Spirochaetia bacterium]
MELHQLRYFLAIAQHGSFTAAAEVCHVSQPSLSAQVAKLEGELGGPLFERSRQGARLTPRGEVFRPRALEALQQLEIGRGELEELSGLKHGEVILGCLPTTGAYVLPGVLKAFRGTHPSLQVKLREESSPILGKALLDAEVDLALVDEAGLAAGVRSDVLFREPLLIIAPHDHPLARRKKISLSSLAAEPFVLMKSGHGFRKIVLDALAQARVEPRVVYETAGIDTVQTLVEAGLGLSLVPSMVRKSKGPAYIEIASPTPTRTIFLARRDSSALSPAAAAMREVIIECLRTPT